MLNVAIEFHGHVALLTVDGDLQTSDDADLLDESLSFAAVGDALVVDLNAVQTVSDECAVALRERLSQRRARASSAVVAGADEVRLALSAHHIDELVSVADTVEAATLAVRSHTTR